MNYRILGNTGIKVSEIGFGTWGIGGATSDGANSYGETDDEESLRALRTAFDLGITLYDTSNVYGYGHSEELLGQAFKGLRDKVVIASKVGMVRHRGSFDVHGSYIRQEIEQSLKRLGTDYLDVYQIHSPPMELIRDTEDAVSTMLELKREGKIKAFGISIKNPAEALIAIKEFGAETVQTNFNMIDQRALEQGVFDLAQERGVGVIARTPLAFGFLSGKIKDFNFSQEDHRSAWSKEQLQRWADAPDLFSFVNRNPERTPTQLALQFCLGFNAVSTVIPGMLKVSEVEENVRASELPGLTPEELENIELVYKKNEFFVKK